MIGAALTAKSAGAGHRRIAAQFGRAASTVRGWLRRFTARAQEIGAVFTALLGELDPLAGIVRYTGTVAGTEAITAAEEVSWHGQTIPAGAIVIPVLGAANRDPTAFDDPERFDIARHPNNHVGFGHGVHFCLGANLARMETWVALQVLLERCPDLRLAVERAQLGIEPLPIITRYREVPVHLG